MDLLDSAVAQPQQGFGGQFLHKDLFEMAAAYLFHIIMNHPFIDGNRRAGLVAALTFLDINGCPIEQPTSALYDMTINVAEGHYGKAEVADAFRALAQ
jgi:death-on-curing protein